MHIPEYIEKSEFIESVKSATLFWSGNLHVAMKDFEIFLDNLSIELKYKKRNLFLFTELVQNIQKHSNNAASSIVWISHKSESIEIHSINATDEINAHRISQEKSKLSDHSNEELRSLIKHRIKEGKEGTGLPEIQRKSKGFSIKLIKQNNSIYLYSKIICHA